MSATVFKNMGKMYFMGVRKKSLHGNFQLPIWDEIIANFGKFLYN